MVHCRSSVHNRARFPIGPGKFASLCCAGLIIPSSMVRAEWILASASQTRVILKRCIVRSALSSKKWTEEAEDRLVRKLPALLHNRVLDLASDKLRA